MSPQQRSRTMSRIRSTNTQPELHVRRVLHQLGYRFRLHGKISKSEQARIAALPDGPRLRGGKLPGSPDLIFPGQRKALFINGCFWHGHGCANLKQRPTSNTGYWNTKLDATISRDKKNIKTLRNIGWTSLTIWECEIAQSKEWLLKTILFLADD